MIETKCKVLLVEDSIVAQKFAKLMLAQVGCEIDIAETGAQAIELVNNNLYDLIFMDLGLPDIDGLILTETIRSMKPPSSNTPIIALTAHFNEEMQEICLKTGMNEFIAKPLTLEGVYRILEKYTSMVRS